MYCPECRESGNAPWAHDKDCITGLRQRVRWYEVGFGLLVVLMVLETALLIVAFIKLGGVP